MAEALFAHKVAKAGLTEQILCDSAGTGCWHIGELAHSQTRRILDANGIHYTNRARQIADADLQEFDYILTMDEQNYLDVMLMGKPKGIVRRLMDYASETGTREVPDPYFSGGYEEVYRLLDIATNNLLAVLSTQHNLISSQGAEQDATPAD